MDRAGNYESLVRRSTCGATHGRGYASSVTEQGDTFDRPVARIEPWGTEDLPLVTKLNEPEMTEHVGGPETPEKIVERQSRYEKADSRQYKIVVEDGGEGVGWVGYWERTWHDQPVLEIGRASCRERVCSTV